MLFLLFSVCLAIVVAAMVTVSEKAHLRRCAASFVTATYIRTSHSSGFARLASGPFTKPSVQETYYETVNGDCNNRANGVENEESLEKH
jgi:cytochrome c biogenesis factor